MDFSAAVEPLFLHGLVKEAICAELDAGGRCCVDAEKRGAVLTALEGNPYKLSAGGSLSNTLVCAATPQPLSHPSPCGGGTTACAREETPPRGFGLRRSDSSAVCVWGRWRCRGW